MATMTKDQRDELRAKAERAKGHWIVQEPTSVYDPDSIPEDICDYEVCEIFEFDAGNGDVRDGVSTIAEGMHETDAAYIAAAHPPTVLALLDALDEAERKVKRLQKALDGYPPMSSMMGKSR